MKKVLTAALVVLCAACVYAKGMKITVKPGENFYNEKGEPVEMAVWLQTPDETKTQTLFITPKAAKKRKVNLPIWAEALAYTDISVREKAEDIKAMAKIPENREFVIDADYSGEDTMFLLVEVNAKKDYNDYYTKKNTGKNGQPSALYATLINPYMKKELVMELVGSGSLKCKDGIIYEDIEHFTTAGKILDSVKVIFENADEE